MGKIEHVGISGFDGAQLGGEVLIAGGAFGFDDPLAAQALELTLEKGGQAHGVVLADVDEHRGLARTQLLMGVARRHLALEGIDETNPEDVLLTLGDDGVGGGGRD